MKPIIALKVLRPGIPYKHIVSLQEYLVANHLTNTLILVEHPPTYTVGRRIKSYSDESKLRDLGAQFFYSKRGGEITFHGPGQLVGYPILNLKQFNARAYICALQKALMKTCDRFDIKTELNEHTGIWVEKAKIAALGVQIQRHITSHGFALNCDTDLTWFDNIVPCGLSGYGVTTLTRVKNNRVTVEEVIPHLVDCFESAFDAEIVDNPIISDVIDQFLDESIQLNTELLNHCHSS